MPAENFERLKAYFKQVLPSLTEECWNTWEGKLTCRFLRKGEFLLKEGMVCDQISFINKGLVRIYYLSDGREKIKWFFNDNTYVSDYQSFLTRKPCYNYIQALEDTEFFETSHANLQLVYQSAPEANILGRLMAERMFVLVNENHALEKRETLEKRYLRLINEQPWLLQKVPQYMIASYLGITPEAFSRVKSRMNKNKSLIELAY